MSGELNLAKNRIRRPVRIWLLIGVVMVFVQVVIGGVTRLTDSGLSITEWAVIQGTLPPMNQEDWESAFELYKIHAKKQFESLHADMSLSEFKVIYFWEYFHRLWARLMGFVFLLPFLFFVAKSWIPKWLLKKLGIVILLAMAAAVFGWIMVASGLNDDNRTWVSAYKLIVHLGIATALFCYLFWTWLIAEQPDGVVAQPRQYRVGWWVAIILLIQILLGGLMAGMRAGLIHPHWPFFIEGDKLFGAIRSLSEENAGLLDYEAGVGVKGLVQIVHRLWAYVLCAVSVWWVLQLSGFKQMNIARGKGLFISLLITQMCLGILTILNCIGGIPVGYAAAHQAVALLLFASLLYLIHQIRIRFPQ